MLGDLWVLEDASLGVGQCMLIPPVALMAGDTACAWDVGWMLHHQWCWVVSAGSYHAHCLPWQVYESGSNVDQFVTRFLLKETANQTQSLLSSVESAVDAIDEQTNPARSAASPIFLFTSRVILVQGVEGKDEDDFVG